MFGIFGLLHARMSFSEQEIYLKNQAISLYLKNLAESSSFSKIKMSFNDKCPRHVEKCTMSSCAVPQMNFQGKNGVIDLLKYRESYSPYTAGSSLVWKDIYNEAVKNNLLRKLISGLHFSVTTHISAFYTSIFTYYFSNPLIYQKRFEKEYQSNFFLLYSLIRVSIANLKYNPSDIPKDELALSNQLHDIILNENLDYQLYGQNSGTQQSQHVSFNHIGSQKDSSESTNEQEILLRGIPKIDKNLIEMMNKIIRNIACLNCQKCKLWGTIQAKGIKAMIKSLNNMPLYPNDVICLINVFRRLSVSVNESRRLGKARFVYLNLLIICHRQVLVLTSVILILVFFFVKLRKTKKIKYE